MIIHLGWRLGRLDGIQWPGKPSEPMNEKTYQIGISKLEAFRLGALLVKLLNVH